MGGVVFFAGKDYLFFANKQYRSPCSNSYLGVATAIGIYYDVIRIQYYLRISLSEKPRSEANFFSSMSSVWLIKLSDKPVLPARAVRPLRWV